MKINTDKWTIKQWNLAAWILFRQSLIKNGFAPDIGKKNSIKMYSNYNYFISQFTKLGFLGDWRQLARKKIHEIS